MKQKFHQELWRNCITHNFRCWKSCSSDSSVPFVFKREYICIGCQFSDLGFFLRTCCKATPKNEPSDIDLKNKLRKLGTPSWNLLSGLLKQNSIPSKQKHKKHQLQLQKTQDDYQPKFHWPNHEGFQKTSAKNRSLTPALANETGPARQLSWMVEQAGSKIKGSTETDVKIILYVDIEQARTVMMWYYVLQCYNMLW